MPTINPLNIIDKDGGHRGADSVQTPAGHAPDNALSAAEKGTEAISGLIMRGPETGLGEIASVPFFANCLRPLFRATESPRRASDLTVSAASFQIDVPDTVLARARRGEIGALEQIYRAFERPSYTLALRMLGDADHARETRQPGAVGRLSPASP